jgi:two-component system, NtrC family, sensor kinase
MTRRSSASGRPVEARRRKTAKAKVKAKVRNKPEGAGPSAANQHTDIVRLTGQLNEALEQQTATSEVLQIISSFPGDLQPVFASMLENGVRICDAAHGNIYLLDGDALKIVASLNTPAALAEVRGRSSFRPGPKNPIGRMVATKQLVHVTDAAASEAYREGDPVTVAAVELGGVRSVIVVPMLKENELIGALTLARSEVRPFSEKQIELVQNFAAQAVIAIENARLLNELRQRTDDLSQRTSDLTEALEQQTATSKVLEVISRSAFDLQAVFETVAENSVRLCEADRAIIFRFDGKLLRMAVAYNTPLEFKKFFEQNPIRLGRHSSSARAALERRTIHIPDVWADPEYTYMTTEYSGSTEAREAEVIHTVLSVPILKGDNLLGVLTIYHLEGIRPFTDKQIALVETFADQAAIAIDNVRLLDELREHTNDLTESLEQQTATSEILEVISNFPTDSQPAFDAIVRSGLRLFPNGVVVISLPDGDQVRLAAIAGADADDREKLRARYPLVHSREYITSTAIMDARELDFADAREAPAELRRGAHNFLASGYRGITVVPMLRGDTAIGAISIVRRQPGALTEKRRELLRIFASQAVIAIENTRLFRELRARTNELGRSVEELRALGEVSQAVNSTIELETVLSTIVAKAVQLSGTEAGAIYVVDDRRREFHLRAAYGMDQHLIDALTQRRIEFDDPNVAQALAEPEPIQVADLREDFATEINEITLRAGYLARLVAP